MTISRGDRARIEAPASTRYALDGKARYCSDTAKLHGKSGLVLAPGVVRLDGQSAYEYEILPHDWLVKEFT